MAVTKDFIKIDPSMIEMFRNSLSEDHSRSLYEQKFNSEDYRAMGKTDMRYFDGIWNWLDSEGTINPLCEIVAVVTSMLAKNGCGDAFEWFYGEETFELGYSRRSLVSCKIEEVHKAWNYGKVLRLDFRDGFDSLIETDVFGFSYLTNHFMRIMETMFPSRMILDVHFDKTINRHPELITLYNQSFEVTWIDSISKYIGDHDVIHFFRQDHHAPLMVKPREKDAKEVVTLFTNRTTGIFKSVFRTKELTDVMLGDTFSENEMSVLQMCGLDKSLWLHEPRFRRINEIRTVNRRDLPSWNPPGRIF